MKKRKLRCERACEKRNIVVRPTEGKIINYHFEGLHKTTCYKT